MSVIVRGMEMPKNCMSCPFPAVGVDAYYCHCPTQDGKEYDFKYADTIPDTCPLIELPPHGRLIDADEPMTKISTMMQEPDYQHEGEGWMVGLIMARDAIDEAPTVIKGDET